MPIITLGLSSTEPNRERTPEEEQTIQEFFQLLERLARGDMTPEERARYIGYLRDEYPDPRS